MKKFIIPLFFAIFIIGATIFVAVYVFDIDLPFSSEETEEEVVEEIAIEFNVQNESTREVFNPSTEVTVTSTQELELVDGPSAEIEMIGEKDQTKYYILRLSLIPDGQSTRIITLGNGTGSTESVEVSIERESGVIPPGYGSIEPWEEFDYVLDGNSLFSVVNRENRLLEDYVPKDLVNLNEEFGIYTLNDAELRRDAAATLSRMWLDAADETGDLVTVVSAYRSYDEQFRLHAGYIKSFGEEETLTFSAKPGFSEHQLGVTIDLANEETGYQLIEEFANTNSGKWFIENSYDYGWVPSYPKESQEQTGFYEPWQFRYVGIENAKEFRESGMSLHDWLRTK